jgi:Tol biopolymer transport system component
MVRSRRRVSGRVLLVLAALLLPTRLLLAAEEPSVRLVSKGGPGRPAIGGTNVAISADGRYVAFAGSSGAAVAGLVDTNEGLDIFLFDRITGETALVSRSIESPLRTANRETSPGSTAISADGRFVVFGSPATDLVTGYDGLGDQLYLYSRIDRSVTLISHHPGAPSQGVASGSPQLPSISADGGYVAFVCNGTQVVGGSSAGPAQVFLFERSTGIVRLVSHTLASETTPGGTRRDFAPSISADGSLVAFLSNTNLVTPSAEVVVTQVYLYRREDRGVALVSHAFDGATSFGDWPSTPPALSADGRFVAFSSASTNLVEGFVIGGFINQNIFLYSVADGSIDLISPAAGTTVVGGNGYSGSIVSPAISADGGFVAFQSRATNLVPGFQGPAFHR